MSFIVCGLDFGTLGARCVLVDALTGKELSTAEHAYRHGVLEGAPGEAFQDPADYKEALSKVIREAVKRAGTDASEIRAVGLDFTACTILPVDEKLTPLCFFPEFRKNLPRRFRIHFVIRGDMSGFVFSPVTTAASVTVPLLSIVTIFPKKIESAKSLLLFILLVVLSVSEPDPFYNVSTSRAVFNGCSSTSGFSIRCFMIRMDFAK